MKIRAIIFDVYNTLMGVGPPPPTADAQWQRLCRDMLQIEHPCSRLNFSVAAGNVISRYHEDARARGIPWPEIHWPGVVAEIMPGLAKLPREDQEEFLFRQIQTGHTTCMTAETAQALRWFKERNYLFGIASNAQAYTLRELQEALAVHGLSMDMFEPNLCFWSFEHGFSKPDPHVFRILTARLAAHDILPSEILMVGDRLDNDIQPAKVHGWQTWQLGAAADGDWVGLRAILHGPQAKVSI
jgi:putative hydrolase of the HAD superfamily